jgi:hypothetical protein
MVYTGAYADFVKTAKTKLLNFERDLRPFTNGIYSSFPVCPKL